MPTNRVRRLRERRMVSGLSEEAYVFFTEGPFFEGRDYHAATTEAEREAVWRKFRPLILGRWYQDPAHQVRPAWGEKHCEKPEPLLGRP